MTLLIWDIHATQSFLQKSASRGDEYKTTNSSSCLSLIIEKKPYGGRLLTTILLLWEVPNHHILETVTSKDKLLSYVYSMGKVFKIFESQPYLAGHVTGTEKSLKLKRHTVFFTVNSANI